MIKKKKPIVISVMACLVILCAAVLWPVKTKNDSSGYKEYETLVNMSRTLNDSDEASEFVFAKKNELVDMFGGLLETIESEFGGPVPSDCPDCGELCPEIPMNFFARFFRLVLMKAETLEENKMFGNSCKWNELLMHVGIIANNGGNVMSSLAMTACFQRSSARIFRQIEYLSREEKKELFEELKSLDASLVKEKSTELIQENIKKEKYYLKVYLKRPALDREYCRTVVAFCMIRLLLEDYRSANGTYPDRLEECMREDGEGDFINRIPWKMVYRKEGDSFVLYSCGPDGVDDQGQFKYFTVLAMGEKGDLDIPKY